MRNFIITISILLYVLSGIVIYRALGIPVNNNYYHKQPQSVEPEDLSPKAEDITVQLAREQARNEAVVEELQATIAKLEDKLLIDEKEGQLNAETQRPKNKARILAVIGSGAFRSGQVGISEDLVNAVQGIVTDIMASPDNRVVIEGHTDNIPIRRSPGKRYLDNMELSFLRAKAVASILVKNGISPERISVVGYGDSRPIDSNETVSGRINNRRVEVKLIPEDEEF
jgi:flagellar motor protein MotB